jgi:cob(I)alamin adenosyltransferase
MHLSLIDVQVVAAERNRLAAERARLRPLLADAGVPRRGMLAAIRRLIRRAERETIELPREPAAGMTTAPSSRNRETARLI